MIYLRPKNQLILPPQDILRHVPEAWDHGGDVSKFLPEERNQLKRQAYYTYKRIEHSRRRRYANPFWQQRLWQSNSDREQWLESHLKPVSRRAFLGLSVGAGLALVSSKSRALPALIQPSPTFLDARTFSDNAGYLLRGGGDDAQCIQNAINTAVSSFGGKATIYLGPGPLTFKSQINAGGTGANSIRIIGDGQNTTFASIAYTTATDVITFGNGTTNPAYCGIKGMTFLSTGGTFTGGAIIHFINSYDSLVEDCQFIDSAGNPFHYQVQISGFGGGGGNDYIHYVRKCIFSGSASSSIALIVDAAATDVWLEDIEMGGNLVGGIGIQIPYAYGLSLRNIDMISYAGPALNVNPGTGQTVSDIFMDNVQCDTSNQSNLGTGGAVFGSTNTGGIANAKAIDCWFSSNKGYGVNIFGSASVVVKGAHFTAPSIFNNGKDGMLIGDYTAFVDVVQGEFGDNGQLTTNTYSGLNIGPSSSTIGHIIVTSCRSGELDPLGGTPGTQQYGYVIAANTDYITFANNASWANQTGTWLNSSTGSHNQVTAPTAG